MSTHCHRLLPLAASSSRVSSRVASRHPPVSMNVVVETSLSSDTAATFATRRLYTVQWRRLTFAKYARSFVRSRETHDVADAFRLTCACPFVLYLARCQERGFPLLGERAPSCSVPRSTSHFTPMRAVIDAGGQPPGAAFCVWSSLQLVSHSVGTERWRRSRNNELWTCMPPRCWRKKNYMYCNIQNCSFLR